jgi:hypothetical protein
MEAVTYGRKKVRMAVKWDTTHSQKPVHALAHRTVALRLTSEPFEKKSWTRLFL